MQAAGLTVPHTIICQTVDEALNGFLTDIHLRGGEFEAGRVFFGRPYWNLGAVKRAAARLPGYVEREFDRDVGIRTPGSNDGSK